VLTNDQRRSCGHFVERGITIISTWKLYRFSHFKLRAEQQHLLGGRITPFTITFHARCDPSPELAQKKRNVGANNHDGHYDDDNMESVQGDEGQHSTPKDPSISTLRDGYR
jgi:hypothetical protein